MEKRMVQDWMSSPVITVTPDTTISEARLIIGEHKIRALPVVNEGKVVGILTKRGLLRVDLSFLGDNLPEENSSISDGKVSDIMTRNPITITPQALIPKAARIMLENKITALPVVENGKLVGILTNSDLMSFVINESSSLKKILLVKQYMTDEVVTIDPDTTLLEAHRLVGIKRIRSLPVVLEDRVVGLITRTDLMTSDPSRMTSQNNQKLSLKILTQPVEKIMSHPVISVTPETTLVNASQIMMNNKIHCLLVLDKDKKLAGIITESDLFLMIVQKFF